MDFIKKKLANLYDQTGTCEHWATAGEKIVSAHSAEGEEEKFWGMMGGLWSKVF